ncbi:hypothetical protein SESBI_25355 [Sesbania bispinosa]|nr:hypothetical protein SESBI_25355 [Sesbania bispinosa]
MEREPRFFMTLILHHGGKFVKDEKQGLEYVSGEIDVWEGVNVDTMCLWTPSDMCKEHGYIRFDNIWWNNPDFDLEKGLRPLAEDPNVRKMCNIGMISQNPPNEATIDEDLCRTVDEIVRMTMAPHCLEDDRSEDTEVVHKFANQIHVKETEIDSGVGGIEVEGADMCEDNGGKGSSDENRPYEALEESSDDDYESASDSPYRPPLFQTDDEYEDGSVVPRTTKRVGSNVGSSSRRKRQADNDGRGGSGGTGRSLDGGVG